MVFLVPIVILQMIVWAAWVVVAREERACFLAREEEGAFAEAMGETQDALKIWADVGRVGDTFCIPRTLRASPEESGGLTGQVPTLPPGKQERRGGGCVGVQETWWRQPKEA